MATTQVVHVKVEQLTKFGYRAGGEFVNYSQKLPESDKTRVVPGAEFDAEYYISDGGKQYLNKILASVPSSPVTSAPVTKKVENVAADTERAKRFTPKFTKKEAPDNSMSKADWAAKDRNMMIGGRSHDAAVIVAAMVNAESLSPADALSRYQTILEGMLLIAEKVQ